MKYNITLILSALFALSLSAQAQHTQATPPVSPGMETAEPPSVTPPGTDPHTGEGAGAVTSKQPKKPLKKVKPSKKTEESK